MIYTTLGKIKLFRPCKSGWKKLLSSLEIYPEEELESHRISYAEILDSNGILDTIWCMRCEWFEHKDTWMKFVNSCVAAAYADAADAAAAAAYVAAAYAADAAAATAAYADVAAAYAAADAAAYAAADAADAAAAYADAAYADAAANAAYAADAAANAAYAAAYDAGKAAEKKRQAAYLKQLLSESS